MGRLESAGYTIIEVLIFLGISMLMFATAVVAVGGNQQNIQYSQAVRDFEQQIKDSINDVSNGYYPEYSEIGCRATGAAAARQVDFSAAPDGSPGINEDCISVGKILMVNIDPESIGVGTIVGLNPSIGTSPDLSLGALSPTLAYGSTAAGELNLTSFKPIRYGAQVIKIGSDDYPDLTFSSLSFIQDFNSSVSGSDTRTNGILGVNIYGIVGSIDDAATLDEYKRDVEAMKTATTDSLIKNPPSGFYVCLQSTNNRYARIIIGSGSSSTATVAEFDIEPDGVCS